MNERLGVPCTSITGAPSPNASKATSPPESRTRRWRRPSLGSLTCGGAQALLSILLDEPRCLCSHPRQRGSKPPPNIRIEGAPASLLGCGQKVASRSRGVPMPKGILERLSEGVVLGDRSEERRVGKECR